MSTATLTPRRSRLTEGQIFCYSAACALLLLLSLIWLRAEAGIDYAAFGSYQASGHAAAVGLNPYAPYPETFRSTFGSLIVPDINFNPPCLLPLFQGLSHLSRASFSWDLDRRIVSRLRALRMDPSPRMAHPAPTKDPLVSPGDSRAEHHHRRADLRFAGVAGSAGLLLPSAPSARRRGDRHRSAGGL
jgi:hypothetical protein